MVTYIYTLRDPRDRAVSYVGKTVYLKARYWDHCHKQVGKAHVNHWLTCLYEKGLVPVMETVEEVSQDGDWVEAERRWIAYFRVSGAQLTNCSNGGEGEVGRVLSLDSRTKTARTLKGHPVSVETRAKLSEAHRLFQANKTEEEREAFRAKFRGRKQTSEEKAKQVTAQKGRKMSEAFCLKMSKVNRGKRPSEATMKASVEATQRKWNTGIYPTPAQTRQRAEFIALRPDRTGTKFTEEQRARLRASQKARRQREAQLGA
jgi:hypothetical protein